MYFKQKYRKTSFPFDLWYVTFALSGEISFPWLHALSPAPHCVAMQTVCFLPVFVKAPHMKQISRDRWPKMDGVPCRGDGSRTKKYVCENSWNTSSR